MVLAGGTGATTPCGEPGVGNWPTRTIRRHRGVCLIDLDLQYGSIATYLDLPRREIVFDVLSGHREHGRRHFSARPLQTFEEKLHVLTAPTDMVPLDLVSPDDVQRLIDMARKHFDYVVIDMPKTIVQWAETTLQAAHVYFAMVELDMRSAQNTLRLKRALQSEDLPFEKMRFALKPGPEIHRSFGQEPGSPHGRGPLGISIDLQLPDGGKQITQACDHGLPLASSCGKKPAAARDIQTCPVDPRPRPGRGRSGP